MFVRWKTLKRANQWENGRRNKTTVLYAAYLVKSERVDGKPRQKTVAYLASIKDRFVQYPTHQRYFWQRVHAVLTPLQLPADQQQKIVEKLQQRVPYPSDEVVSQFVNRQTIELKLTEARIKGVM